MAGIGFFIAGVPGAALLALLTFFLSVVPVGPPLVWVPAALWLFHQGSTGWGIFMLVWGVLVSSVDNVVKPWLISQGSDLPFILIFFGVLGGALMFGFIGVFIGPTLLAVGYRLVEEWASANREVARNNEFGYNSPRWRVSMTKDFDLVVIGGGPAGICGANTAGIFGKRVALVEKLREVGGAGINTGTIPSKTLRETALALSGLRSRKLFGVDLSLRREATVADFMRHQENVAAHERRRREEQMRTYNVETFHGAASFVDPNTVRVAPDTLLRGERILIATGSSPVRPAEFPFEHPRVHDSDEILEIGALPKNSGGCGRGRDRRGVCLHFRRSRGRSASDRRTRFAPRFSRSRDFGKHPERDDRGWRAFYLERKSDAL